MAKWRDSFAVSQDDFIFGTLMFCTVLKRLWPVANTTIVRTSNPVSSVNHDLLSRSSPNSSKRCREFCQRAVTCAMARSELRSLTPSGVHSNENLGHFFV
jgi:hypothetical protein